MTWTSVIGFPASKVIIHNASAEKWNAIKGKISEYLTESKAIVTAPDYEVSAETTGDVVIIILDSNNFHKISILKALDDSEVKWEVKNVKVSQPLAGWTN